MGSLRESFPELYEQLDRMAPAGYTGNFSGQVYRDMMDCPRDYLDCPGEDNASRMLDLAVRAAELHTAYCVPAALIENRIYDLMQAELSAELGLRPRQINHLRMCMRG